MSTNPQSLPPDYTKALTQSVSLTIGSSMLENALQAARMGFPVLPTHPDTKRPLIRDWSNQASKEEAVIRTWWAQWPDAMVGAVTGHASGFLVFDVDVKDGKDPFAKIAELEAEFGPLPKSMMVRTPSGGLHVYFLMPEGLDLRNSAGKIAMGIDIRANGGYAIFPGSIRSDGKSYQIINQDNVGE